MPLSFDALPPEVDQQLRSELRVKEKIVWAAQPLARRFGMQSIGIVVFGIPWTAFAVFWVAGAAWGVRGSHQPGLFQFFPLFGVPFILIGVAMLSSPFWLTRKARRTVYAITSERAIVITGRVFGGVNVQSFLPDRLTSMSRNERADGSGDLIFEQFQQRAGSGTTTVRRGFVAIERVREVEDLITSTLLAGRVREI